MSEIRELTEKELDQVSGGKITPVKVNGGGNTPNGQANGVPSENQNPSGFAPPGQN
jgi:bacteriocin-like protein